MSKEEVWDEIEADASKFDALTTEAGSELSEMIRILSDVTSAISKAEESVKSLKKSRDRYLHDLIPGKMAEMGLDKVEVDGNKVSLQTFVSGTMPKDPLETSSKTWVEPMTLKKLIRERVEANQEIDLDIFNAHVGTIAKIKGA